jgi:cold shock CspA family protein
MVLLFPAAGPPTTGTFLSVNGPATAGDAQPDVGLRSGRLGAHTGVVAAYDPDVGVGSVESEGVEWLFHCTTITDGTRQIEPGTHVRFEVRAGGPGLWEAFDVAMIGSSKG